MDTLRYSPLRVLSARAKDPDAEHRRLTQILARQEGTGEKWWSETSAQQCRSGSIKANIGWRH